MKKRMISILLALVMLVSLLPTVALATEATPIDEIYITTDFLPKAGDYVSNYGAFNYWSFSDPYAYWGLNDPDRYSTEIRWYACGSKTAISEIVESGPYVGYAFEAGDYIMALTIIPEEGFSVESLTTDDVSFIELDHSAHSFEEAVTKVDSPKFTSVEYDEINDVATAYARVHIDYVPIDNVYFTNTWLPFAGDSIGGYSYFSYYYGQYYADLYGAYTMAKDRYSNQIQWYACGSKTDVSEIIQTDPCEGPFFECGDYIMAVRIIPYSGYTAEDLTGDDISFVYMKSNMTGTSFEKDPTAPKFTKVGDVFCARVHVSDYEDLQKIAAEKAGTMPEAAAQKLIAKGENYLVKDSVKYKAMSQHQLAVFDAEDFASDKTADFLGISSGIVLSSGDASAAINGGYYDDFKNGGYAQKYCYGEYYGGQSNGDEDLYNEFNPETAYVKYPQFDTATLEFTVKAPEKDYPMSMTFNYAYATQEMTEEEEYNDVFALFVSNGYDAGESPKEFKNYAEMKVDTSGKMDKVTVSNMKNAIVAADQAADEYGVGDNVFYVSENSGVKFVDGAEYLYGDWGWHYEFDDLSDYGLFFNGVTYTYSTTIPNVESGKYYTIKLAIADASDNACDGAVFLQANSLYFGIQAPKVSGVDDGTVVKSFTQPDIQLGVKDYGTVYIVPAGQAYTTEAALKKAAAAVWNNSYKNGVSVLSGVKDGDGYAWSDKVSLAGIRTGYYAAYLVAELGGEKVVSLPSETFYISPYISSLPGNFADPSVNTEHSATEELTVNFGEAEYVPETKTLTAKDIEFVTENKDGIIMPDEGTIEMSGDASVEVQGSGGAAVVSMGELKLKNDGDLTLTARNGAGISSGLGGDVTISGSGKTTIESGKSGITSGRNVSLDAPVEIKSQVGIQSMGSVTLSDDVTINASELGIMCITLTIKEGATLTINTDGRADLLHVGDLVIPDDYEIIGGRLEEGVFIPDEDATQLIIRKKAAVPVYGGEDSYPIAKTATNNGSFTVSSGSAEAGKTVTVTAVPDSGFTVETVTVTDKNGKAVEVKNLGDGKYSFTMPASAVTVSVTFMEDNTMLNFFVDVKADDYFYDAVLWAAENGVTKGVDSTHFGPYVSTTRAQVVTFLWRAAGCPEPTGTAAKFTDVLSGSYYEKAVAWAIEQGITKGSSATTFSPDQACTRAQIVTFLARFAGAEDAAAESDFSDVKATDYFAAAVKWAKDNGVTDGTSATTFSPYKDCTRAQVVTFLYRWMVK